MFEAVERWDTHELISRVLGQQHSGHWDRPKPGQHTKTDEQRGKRSCALMARGSVSWAFGRIWRLVAQPPSGLGHWRSKLWGGDAPNGGRTDGGFAPTRSVRSNLLIQHEQVAHPRVLQPLFFQFLKFVPAPRVDYQAHHMVEKLSHHCQVEVEPCPLQRS